MAWVFGYGSLVNHHTHDSRPCFPARLPGWRREWCLTSLRDMAFLSVRPLEGAETVGLLAQVPGADWSTLDAREFAYDRHHVALAHEAEAPGEAAVYQVAPQYRAEGQGTILLSYLDVVAEGFHHHFGDPGVEAFFATTDHWHPIEDDRGSPKYTRHRQVSAHVRVLVDRHLSGISL